MPQLSPEQFEAVAKEAIAKAPPGLSAADFQEFVLSQAAEAERQSYQQPAPRDVGADPFQHTVYGQIGEAVKGAGKGLASTVFHGGDLIRRATGMERVIDRPEVQAAITPTNAAQQIGRGVEQAAEVVFPMGAISRVTKGAPLLARMASEGAGMAGIAAAQGSDPTTAGVIGAVIPAAGAALKTVPASLRESAQKKVAQALGATKERFKAIAEKRAPEILKRGLHGSRSSLLADATAHAKEAGAAIDDVLKTAGDQRIPTGPVVEALEEAKAAFQQVRRLSIGDAARSGLTRSPGARIMGSTVEVPVVIDARPIEQLTKLQQTIRELGDDASVEQLVAVRRVWDDVVARVGGFAHRQSGAFGVPLAEQTEAWAKREATKAIRKVLAKEVPELKEVNATYAFWKDLKDVLTATQKRTQPQGPGLSRTIGGIVGAATAYSSGRDPMTSLTSAVALGYVAPKVVAAITSPQWRLASAHLRNALADGIASGSVGQMTSAATRILAVQGSKLVPTPSSVPAGRP